MSETTEIWKKTSKQKWSRTMEKECEASDSCPGSAPHEPGKLGHVTQLPRLLWKSSKIHERKLCQV